MFGQPSAPFGSPPATNNPTGFGTQTNTTPAFGGGSTFGAPAPSTGFGGFGTPAPAPTGFGGFGAPAPAPTGFGTTSAFGTPAAAPATGAFGSTTTASPFGAPAPSTGGIFGNPAPAPTGLFGSAPAPATGAFGTTPAPATSGFGGFGTQTNTASAFGAPATGAFGTPAPAPGLFGSTTTPGTTSAFGTTPATTSAFGAPAPAPSIFGGTPAPTPGLFGSPAAGQQGTRNVQFQATNKVDGTSSISLQSISAMTQFENKSAEELRFEDYSMGNKGTGSGGTPGGMGFGSNAPAPSAFGAPAPAPGLFGSPPAPAPSAFGTTSAFGAPAPATGAFGAPAPATGAFGAPAPATGAFGAPTPAPAFGGFGSTTPAPAPFGGFGAAPANAPAPGIFGGAPAPAPGASLFGGGAPAPATTGLFGATPAPASGNLFSSTPAPATSLFGAPAPATGAFGSTPAPGVFGAPTAAPTTLFGATPAPSTGFGAPAPAPGGSLFGAPAPTAGGSLFGGPKPAGGGLFGSTTPAQPPATGLFGAPPATAAAPFAISTGGVPVGSIQMPSQDALLMQQLNAVQRQTEELKKLEVWRSGASQGPTVTPQPLSESASRLSSYSAATGDLSSYRTFPKSSAQIRPRGFGPAKSPATSIPTSVRALENGGSPVMSPNAYIGSSVKRLVIKPDSLTKKPSGRLLLQEHPAAAAPAALEGSDPQGATTPLINGRVSSPHTPASEQVSESATQPSSQDRGFQPQSIAASSRQTPPASEQSSASSSKKSTPMNGYGYEFYRQVVSPTGVTTPVSTRDSEATTPTNSADFRPKLTNEGYSTSPSMEELSLMSEADLAAVTGFTVSRGKYGNVVWDGAVDVRGVDLDSVITIDPRVVEVYEAQQLSHTKPPVGSKLNRPAVITMYDLFPPEGRTAGPAIMKKFRRKLQKKARKIRAEHISYNPANGEWKFRVQHFSRYAFDDDSDSDEDSVPDEVTGVDFESGERGGLSPGTRKEAGQDSMDVAEEDEAEVLDKSDEDVGPLISDAESPESKILRAAEDAYAMFVEMDVNDAVVDANTYQARAKDDMVTEESDIEDFPEEGWSEIVSEQPEECDPPKDIPFVSSETGIVAKLLNKSALKSETGSSTDYGMRMGRSFRVGWRPDGSFLQLRPASREGNRVGTLVMGRPMFSDGKVDGDVGRSNLETHLRHSSRASTSSNGCPFFSLPKTADSPLGTPSTHAEWCNALEDYSQSAGGGSFGVLNEEQQSQDVACAFSLLLALYGVEKTAIEEDSSSFSRRRVQAFENWLKVACAEDVRSDIRSAGETNDVHSAILAALSGGDISQASQIAAENGYSHLSTVMCAGFEGRKHIHEQVQRWRESGASSHIPQSLLRIYTLLGGDLEIEQKLYSEAGDSAPSVSLDWRRRLAVLLFYGHADIAEQHSISSVIRAYDTDVSSELAPYPSPRYANNGSNQDLSLLYRILHLYVDGEGRGGSLPRSLSEIISPAGYTTARHNYSHAFHLAAVVSSVGSCFPLSSFEKGHLLNSYAAQLVDAGLWEWASYVYLCLTDDASADELEWRKIMAKNVVLQHFRSDDSLASSRRSFLEQAVGLPSSWFEEALSERCGYVGDIHGYVTHSSKCSPDLARKAFEELMLSKLLFVPSKGESTALLELFGSEEGTLASAAFDLHRLSIEVQRLVRTEGKATIDSAAQLLEEATQVQARLHEYRTNERISRSRSFRMYPGYRVLPLSSFLSGAISTMSFVILQLQALKAGISIVDDQSSVVRMKVASQLAFASADSLPLDQHGSSVDDLLMGSI